MPPLSGTEPVEDDPEAAQEGSSTKQLRLEKPAGQRLGSDSPVLKSTVSRRELVTLPPHSHQSKSGPQQTGNSLKNLAAASNLNGHPQPRQKPTAIHAANADTLGTAQQQGGQFKRRRAELESGSGGTGGAQSHSIDRRDVQRMDFQQDGVHQPAATHQVSPSGRDRQSTRGIPPSHTPNQTIMTPARRPSEAQTQAAAAAQHDRRVPPLANQRPIVKRMPKYIPPEIHEKINQIATQVHCAGQYTNAVGEIDLVALYADYPELWEVMPETKIEERIDIAVKTLEYHMSGKQ